MDVCLYVSCMYVCIYVYECMCMYVIMFIYTYVCTYVCMYIHIMYSNIMFVNREDVCFFVYMYVLYLFL